MTIQVTTNLTNSIRTQYLSNYMEAAVLMRLYDQLASPVAADMSSVARGSSVTIPVLSSLAPTSQTISQTADITPTTLRDAVVTLTPTSRANAIMFSEALEDQVYTDYTAQAYKKVGENMMESVDWLAMTAACAGSLAKSPTTRSSLDAGTSTHRLSLALFNNAGIILSDLRVPQYLSPRGKRWIALFHPFAYKDLIADTVITAVGEYQNPGIVLNNELGELSGFSIVVSPFAKVFYGAGAANGSAVATTLAASVNALATTFTVASGSNIAAGQRLRIGTAETAGTHQLTNESVIVTGIDSVTVSFIGQGENGGMKYDHAAGVSVSNADNVIPVVFGGPESLAKVYSPSTGEYGEVVGPKTDGLVDQFKTLGWKWYGGYGIINGNRILRTEVSTSMDA